MVSKVGTFLHTEILRQLIQLCGDDVMGVTACQQMVQVENGRKGIHGDDRSGRPDTRVEELTSETRRITIRD